jgi:hypothetical protein
LKFGSLDLLEPSGLVQAFNWIALPFTFTIGNIFILRRERYVGYNLPVYFPEKRLILFHQDKLKWY